MQRNNLPTTDRAGRDCREHVDSDATAHFLGTAEERSMLLKLVVSFLFFTLCYEVFRVTKINLENFLSFDQIISIAVSLALRPVIANVIDGAFLVFSGTLRCNCILWTTQGVPKCRALRFDLTSFQAILIATNAPQNHQTPGPPTLIRVPYENLTRGVLYVQQCRDRFDVPATDVSHDEPQVPSSEISPSGTGGNDDIENRAALAQLIKLYRMKT